MTILEKSDVGSEAYAAWKREPQQLFEQAPVAILVFDNELRYIDANTTACELYGRKQGEIVGRHVGDFSAGDAARVARRVLASTRDLVVAESIRVMLVDGTTRVLEISTRANVLPGIHLSFAFDTTEREQMRRELEHHNRLEAIGKLAGGVAHDFNNMLTAILSYVDLQLATTDEENSLRRYAFGIRAAAERASETTHQLLAFCRRQKMQFSEVDINQQVRDASQMVRRLIGEDVEVILQLEEELPPVLADPGQINQLLVNLMVNARDAMPGGGKISVGTSTRRTAMGHQVSIFVHDTGSGISATVLPHIFEPFFTTKPRGKGTGLGLSTVYGIVKQTKGKILVNSQPGRGTTFEVVLPAAGEADNTVVKLTESTPAVMA